MFHYLARGERLNTAGIGNCADKLFELLDAPRSVVIDESRVGHLQSSHRHRLPSPLGVLASKIRVPSCFNREIMPDVTCRHILVCAESAECGGGLGAVEGGLQRRLNLQIDTSGVPATSSGGGDGCGIIETVTNVRGRDD